MPSHVCSWHKADIQRLLLWIAFEPARMVAEIPLAILSATLRVAATSWAALVGVDLEANS